MLINTTRFGNIEVSAEAIIDFPQGLPGFQQEKNFVLLPYQPDSPFGFLQSVTDPDLTFVVVEPFSFVADYSFVLDDTVLQELDISTGNHPSILNIVRIPDKVDEMTANLAAPVIINKSSRKAMQVILDKTAYSVRHRLFPDKGGK